MRFIGVIAAFRDIERARWKTLIPIKPHLGNTVTIEADDITVTGLTVQSQVGKGSVFRIWLKSSDLAQMEEFTVGSDTLPVRIEEVRTVLLIDDEEPIRASVSELLRQWGYTVLAVATASEALAAALNHESTIDVVISDLRLRGGEDGIHAIEQVRRVCGFTVPALLVTGDTAPDQVQRIDESGHIVLFKPVQPKDLYAVLKRMT